MVFRPGWVKMLCCVLMKEAFFTFKSMNQWEIKYTLDQTLSWELFDHGHMGGAETETKRIGIAP